MSFTLSWSPVADRSSLTVSRLPSSTATCSGVCFICYKRLHEMFTTESNRGQILWFGMSRRIVMLQYQKIGEHKTVSQFVRMVYTIDTIGAYRPF
jgi:hypothetical protein